MGTKALDIKTRFDINSGVAVNYREASRWYDNSILTIDKLDGVIFGKIEGKFHQKTISKETYLKVGTVYELRQTNGYYEGQEITLLGYYQSGDKRPVTYKFTVANFGSLVDDGGMIIKTDRGSWIGQFNGNVHARDFGCSESLADNSDIFNKMILNTAINEISVKGATLKFTHPIFINRKIKIKGIVRSTLLDFTLLTASEYAFRFASSAAVNGLEISGLRILGNTSANCFRFNQTNNINFSVTDSVFKNIRAEGFNIGISTQYTWCNIFDNVRFVGCIEPLQLNSQTNQIDFRRCSFTGFKKAYKFTNCEGITFSTCNFGDFNKNLEPDATQGWMSLFQSNVVLINCYYEYLSSGVLSVGGSNETNQSTLTAIGGKVTEGIVRVRINGNNTKINVKGLNNTAGKDGYFIENASNDVAPTNYVREIYLDNKQYAVSNTIAKFDGNQEWRFSTYGGSASNIVSTNKGFKTIQINGPANTGFRITNNLVVGENYILAYMINKNAGTGDLRIHHGLDYQILKIQNLGDDYEMRFVPFKAMATNLDMASTVIGDSFDIRYIIVVKGNNLPDSYDKTYIPHAYVIPTAVGDFTNGDIVKNATNGDIYYSLVSGVWTTLRTMKQSAAVPDVLAANSLQITLDDLIQISTGNATDPASTQALVNELKAAFNTAVLMINDIKGKYNITSTLSNANKSTINDKLSKDRASGQQL